MTNIFLRKHVASSVAEPRTPLASESVPETMEFDEDGRRYVFRYPPTQPQRYCIDRDRLFEYMKKHRLPDHRARRHRRDARNAANFFEDVRDIQTHPDVVAVSARALETSETPVTELRMRRAG